MVKYMKLNTSIILLFFGLFFVAVSPVAAGHKWYNVDRVSGAQLANGRPRNRGRQPRRRRLDSEDDAGGKGKKKNDAPSVSPAPSPDPGTQVMIGSAFPSFAPSERPSTTPSTTQAPSGSPTFSMAPSTSPQPTSTGVPSSNPSEEPTTSPSSGMPSTSPSDEPSLSPSTQPSSVPSVPPSLSQSPSEFPSILPSTSPSHEPSMIPSTNPSLSSFPSTSPSKSPQPSMSDQPSSEPSAVPSVTPTLSAQPSESPTKSPQPSLSFAPTTTVQPSTAPSGDKLFVRSDTADSLTFMCEVQNPNGYASPPVFQRFDGRANICPNGAVTDLQSTAQALLRDPVVPGLADRLLDCEYNDGTEFVAVMMFDNDPVEVTPTGNGCYSWQFFFQMNYIVEVKEGRRLDVQETISDTEVAQTVKNALAVIFATIDGLTITLEDFGNIATNNQDPPPSNGGTTTEVLQSETTGDDDRSVTVPVMTVACSVLVLAIVGVLAVRKKRVYDKNLEEGHILLKDSMDLEDMDDLDFGTPGISTGSILRDLDPTESFDDEEVSTVYDSSVYPKVYVLGEGDQESAEVEYDELRFTSEAYEIRGDRSVARGTTFVTADLRNAMKDLQPPPVTPQRSGRRYIHDDTIDL